MLPTATSASAIPLDHHCLPSSSTAMLPGGVQMMPTSNAAVVPMPIQQQQQQYFAPVPMPPQPQHQPSFHHHQQFAPQQQPQPPYGFQTPVQQQQQQQDLVAQWMVQHHGGVPPPPPQPGYGAPFGMDVDKASLMSYASHASLHSSVMQQPLLAAAAAMFRPGSSGGGMQMPGRQMVSPSENVPPHQTQTSARISSWLSADLHSKSDWNQLRMLVHHHRLSAFQPAQIGVLVQRVMRLLAESHESRKTDELDYALSVLHYVVATAAVGDEASSAACHAALLRVATEAPIGQHPVNLVLRQYWQHRALMIVHELVQNEALAPMRALEAAQNSPDTLQFVCRFFAERVVAKTNSIEATTKEVTLARAVDLLYRLLSANASERKRLSAIAEFVRLLISLLTEWRECPAPAFNLCRVLALLVENSHDAARFLVAADGIEIIFDILVRFLQPYTAELQQMRQNRNAPVTMRSLVSELLHVLKCVSDMVRNRDELATQVKVMLYIFRNVDSPYTYEYVLSFLHNAACVRAECKSLVAECDDVLQLCVQAVIGMAEYVSTFANMSAAERRQRTEAGSEEDVKRHDNRMSLLDGSLSLLALVAPIVSTERLTLILGTHQLFEAIGQAFAMRCGSQQRKLSIRSNILKLALELFRRQSHGKLGELAQRILPETFAVLDAIFRSLRTTTTARESTRLAFVQMGQRVFNFLSTVGNERRELAVGMAQLVRNDHFLSAVCSLPPDAITVCEAGLEFCAVLLTVDPALADAWAASDRSALETLCNSQHSSICAMAQRLADLMPENATDEFATMIISNQL